jgi:hypothetical protein
VTTLVLSAQTAAAAGLLLFKEFKLHDFDTVILQVLGYDTGSVLYLREMGSISTDEINLKASYENIGCHPYYVMRDGVVSEHGYNCQTFFCVGYKKGPKQCRDRDGKATGGVVEINERLAAIIPLPKQTFFTGFSSSLQTDAMKLRVARLEAIRCRPFYMMFWNVAIAEGYECDEVGQYPYFSNENRCVNDWKTTKGYQCDVPIRANEYEMRLEAIAVMEGTGSRGSRASSKSSRTRSGASSVSSESSASSASSSFGPSESSAASVSQLFPDVAPDHEAFLEITALADLGVVSGYPDGTFRPDRTVTRSELLKLLLGALHPAENRGEGRCFLDVATDWYAPYVCAAKRLAWVSGYKDGRFRPGNTVTRAEAIKMVVQAAGVRGSGDVILPPDVAPSAWFAPFVRAAAEYGIMTDASFNANAPLTRSDAAVWIHRTIEARASVE